MTAMAFKRVEFAIPPADFVLGALLLGHVEQEALVALDLSGGVAGGETAFHGGEQRAVLAAQGDFKVADVIVQLYFAPEDVALFVGGVKLGVDVSAISSSRLVCPSMRMKASLQSSSLPSGVATKTPSCI